MEHPAWLRWDGTDLILTVRVQPRASRERVLGVQEDALRIALTAPPVEGAANEALSRLLAKELEVATGRVRIVQGEQARNKVVRIAGADQAKVTAWRQRVGER
ncbi:MAG: YggU family protein [Magnetococcales bacterium]|nr:YggU family protein [Magnetococcales bacterium]